MTPEERTLYAGFKALTQELGISPSIAELAAYLNCSKSPTYNRVVSLIGQGLLRRTRAAKARNIELVPELDVELQRLVRCHGRDAVAERLARL